MGCGCEGLEATQHSDGKHRNVLWAMLLINFIMFVIEFSYGILAHSTALLADSADMFADAFVYGMSIFVVGKGILAKARVSFYKGILMGAIGLFALSEAISKLVSGVMPVAETMGIIGFLALIANIACVLLLLKHRDDDINMKSTWICSRNDVIANLGIICAAFLVNWLGSSYPDIIIGSLIGLIILRSSIGIIIESKKIISENKA